MPRRRMVAVGLFVAALAAGVAVGWLTSTHSGPVSAPARTDSPDVRRVLPRPHPRPEPQHLRPSRAAVPILMYHVIAPPISGAPFPELYLRPADFAAEMNRLARAGYHAVTLDQVWRAWHGKGRLPARPIVLSFDNGYRSQYVAALPVLRRLGWVGDEFLQLSGLPPKQGGLSSREVRALLRAGWELDTQGYSHADLNQLDASGLRFQLADARRRLRRLYGAPVDWLAYPSGHYDPGVIAETKAAGFLGGTTVLPGWARPADDPFRLPRLRVLGGTGGAALLAEVSDAARSERPPPTYPLGGG